MGRANGGQNNILGFYRLVRDNLQSIECVCVPLRQQPVMGKVANFVDIFDVVSILGLD